VENLTAQDSLGQDSPGQDSPGQDSPPRGIGDTYQLLAKLSEGGMGAIYKARHRHLNQVRVIKVMRPQFEDNKSFQTRFLREAQLAAEVSHPNIAQLYEYAVTPSGIAYMVLEFIDGLTLEQVLGSSGAAPVGLAVELTRQALAALGHLHDHGSVHRDVSPDNLMLTRTLSGAARLKLIDLGIAKQIKEPDDLQVTRTGTFIGKVRYAAPEQFSANSKIDYRSDLYSLGVVLYELVTGQFPIQGTDTSSLIAGHLFHGYLPFDESDPHGRVPEALRAAIDRALAKSPDERFSTAEEFAEALSQLQLGDGLEDAELSDLFERGRVVYPAAPEHSAEDGDEALWRLLDKSGSQSVDASGTGALSGAESLPGTPSRRARNWAMTAAAVTLTAVLAAGALTVRQWWPASSPPATGEDAAQRAPITQPISLGRYFALVIGNDAYRGGLEPLTTAVADARAVGDLLESEYGFEVQRLFNATYAQVRTGIESYLNLNSEDNLLIFYAGHGRLEGEGGYWLPVDAESDSTANWISNRDISETLSDLPANHVLVMADSCYSGTLAGGGGLGVSPATSEAERLAYVEQMKSRVARVALTSGGQAPVLDRGSGTHSVFTNALLGVLEGNPDVLETALLYTRLNERVSAAVERLAIELEPGYSQVPEYAPIPSAGDAGGEFFFAPIGLQAL